MKQLLYRTGFFSILIMLGASALFVGVHAQPVLSQQTVSMGGGSGYITGPAANFFNPANLMIRDKLRRNRLVLGQGGFYLSEGVAAADLLNEYNAFEARFSRYNGRNTHQDYSSEEILQRRFPDDNTTFAATARYDVLAFGISFLREDYAFSLALRSRSSNAFELNRGWYDPALPAGDDGEMLERKLRQNLQTYHEISFGLAGEVTLINGMMPGMNKLYFGIAPKLVAGGLFFKGDYSSVHFRESGEGPMPYAREFSASGMLSRSAGSFSEASGSSLLETAGLGLGLDVGFTFIKGLDDDVSLAPGSGETLRKSLRFSLSMTDIGFVSYKEQPVLLNTRNDAGASGSSPPEFTGWRFIGQVGEFADFIGGNAGDATVQTSAGEKRVTQKLPAAVHLGTVFQYNRLMASVDLEYELNPVHFHKQGWQTSFGAELRLLNILPIRSGVSFSPAMDPLVGLGVGFDADIWEFSIAAQFKKGYDDRVHTIGLAVAALQFRF
ncbi:MAG: DUF5723 family protein [Balneolales bacterium]